MELKKGNNSNFFQFVTVKYLFCLSDKSKTCIILAVPLGYSTVQK